MRSVREILVVSVYSKVRMEIKSFLRTGRVGAGCSSCGELEWSQRAVLEADHNVEIDVSRLSARCNITSFVIS